MSYIGRDKPSLQELMHYGMPRRSGRYPWGSGKEPYQHSSDFVSRVDELKKQGLSENEIAKYFDMTSTNFRKEYRVANNERRYLEVQKMQSLRDKGYSNYKIGEIMGMNESTVRSKLNPHSVAKLEQSRETYNFLKKRLEEDKYIDVGKDVERELNISRGKLDEALYMLEMEGCKVYERHVDQPTMPGQKTTVKTLCRQDVELKELLSADVSEIKSLTEYTSSNDGETFHKKFVYPKSMDSSRLLIKYKEDGGEERDGTVELRRGVEDLSLGGDRYSQVRILVDDDRYIKGMAVYGDDMPDGIDVVFWTNKKKGTPVRDVLKPIKTDKNGVPEANPFGSSIKDAELGGQYYYRDKNGKEQLGLINKRASEGDWDDWSNALPSQFLSKQPKDLVTRQLNMAKDEKKAEFDEICSLTNPTVKKQLLMDFAENCDSAAVHLKAASLPRQKYHVIVSSPTISKNEVYAPGYKDGEKVALIRYPHGGTFEIPVLTVNNKHAASKKLIGSDSIDAICINKEVADRLSGADFDGDTVMVIPTNDKVRIKSTPVLKDLEGFDPKMEYGTVKDGDDYINKYGEKIKVMRNTQNEMGRISNLITDMTIIGATDEEKARAVKHSMVVIDAEKHKLDYKQSEIDNDIKSLREKYQKKINPVTGEVTYGGASTLISRAKSQASMEKTQGTPKINIKGEEHYDPTKPEGALIYKKADDLHYAEFKTYEDKNMRGYVLSNGKEVKFDKTDKEQAAYYKPVKKVDPETGKVTFTNSTGELEYKTKIKTQKTTKMAKADDAMELVSTYNHPIELLYADYANSMKALANQARKEYAMTGEIEYSPSANKIYSNEVNSLLSKLNTAQKNSPRERRATILANSYIDAKLKDNPDLKNHKADLKKYKDQAMQRARAAVGAKRTLIEVTDKEWEAIQAGAISKTKLKEILRYADMDSIKTRAMPRDTKTLNTAQAASLKSKYNSGNYTIKQLADSFGISVSTAYKLINGQ